MEGTTRNTATATIKRKTRGEEEVEENKKLPRKKPNHSTVKQLPYADKK